MSKILLKKVSESWVLARAPLLDGAKAEVDAMQAATRAIEVFMVLAWRPQRSLCMTQPQKLTGPGMVSVVKALGSHGGPGCFFGHCLRFAHDRFSCSKLGCSKVFWLWDDDASLELLEIRQGTAHIFFETVLC